ncbi:hypothetical protein FIC39_14195 [Escherichia coli]|nr:hypothetical protein FIC39_14195 [Escherichia coli]
MFAGKKSAQIREILISESAWEEMTCLFAPSLTQAKEARLPIAVATPPAITALATSIEKSPRKLTRSRSELIINSMVLQATENQIQNLTPFIDSDKAPHQPIASSRT